MNEQNQNAVTQRNHTQNTETFAAAIESLQDREIGERRVVVTTFASRSIIDAGTPTPILQVLE